MQQFAMRNRPGLKLVVTAAVSMLFALTGCKGDKGDTGSEGPAGPAGPAGSACTLADTGAGKTITCPDGTTVTLTNGQDGQPGTDGTSCTVADNGNGTKTITCGTTTVTVADGAAGQNGQNGENGTSCTAADNGNGTKTITCGTTSVTVSDGAAGAAGEDGENCTLSEANGVKTITCPGGSTITIADGKDGLNAVGGKLKLVIDGVVTDTVAAKATLTFTIYPAVAACPDGTCGNLSNLTQKTFYATEYVPATKTFTKSFSFSGFAFKALVKDASGLQGAQYTATKTSPSFAPETSTNAMVYGYIADDLALPAKGNYKLPKHVASASKVYGTIDYESTVDVAGCETCHVAPYSKHGYRQARVAGLPDMASCKACHTDQRSGGHELWQILVDDPAAAAAIGSGSPSAAQKAKYAYTANVMNDTHMSHAMEFAYPQSIANCTTCHKGKLDKILTQDKFTLTTCKSCHALKGNATYADPKRAPALVTVLPTTVGAHNTFIADPYNYTGAACNTCHNDAGGMGFKTIHNGMDKQIYDSTGAKYADTVKAVIDSVDYTAPTLTVVFHVTGAPTGAVVDPLFVGSLYGYNSKDFVVSGHGSYNALDINGATIPNPNNSNKPYTIRNLEGSPSTVCPTGAVNCYLTVTADATDPTKFTAVANLTFLSAKLTGGTVKRLELGVLPKVTLGTSPNSYDIAAAGVTKTFDIAANALVADADAYGRNITDAGKCNACHNALGTTFHNPNYGSAGALGCRLCHTVNNGGSHLEMQSRSIDSYVHAIHSFQVFDVGGIDFADPVKKMRYNHHIESTYPNFSILNCESCHNAGTYEVPDQTKSLPGLFSASYTNASMGRTISGVPAYTAGPGNRACGSCHRAEMINEDAAGELASFNAHTAAFGTLATPADQTKLDSITATIMSYFGFTAPTTKDVDARMESCSTCHPNAGAEHQTAFNAWKTGL